MKKIFILFAFVGIFSCNNEQDQKKKDSAKSESAEMTLPIKTSVGSIFDAALDSSSTTIKETKLHDASVKDAEWRDVVCGSCGKRCCSPCTAGGNISSCAQTRFRECSVCNHASSGHYSAPH